MKKRNPLKENKERGARKKAQSVKGLPCMHEGLNCAETNSQKPRCRSEEVAQCAKCSLRKCEDGSLNTQSLFNL